MEENKVVVKTIQEHLMDINEALNHGCGKNAAIKAMKEYVHGVASTSRNLVKKTHSYTVRLVSNDVPTTNLPPNTVVYGLIELDKEAIKHLCQGGQVKVTIDNDRKRLPDVLIG